MATNRKISIVVTEDQIKMLANYAKRRGQTIAEVARNFVIDMMDAENILPVEHLCPMCQRNITVGASDQVCEQCEDYVSDQQAL